MVLKKEIYKPGKERHHYPGPVLTPASYYRLVRAKKVPRGASVESFVAKEKTAAELGIIFRSDGRVEIPRHVGIEGKVKESKPALARNIAFGIKSVYHQINGVKENIYKTEKLYDILTRVNYDLVEHWSGYSEEKKNSFVEYFGNLLTELSKRPELVKHENKTEMVGRIKNAISLMKQKNSKAAAAKIAGIKNDALDLLRIQNMQLPYLERRKRLLEKEKFRRDKIIFESIEPLSDAYYGLSEQLNYSELNKVAETLSVPRNNLFNAEWQEFRQPSFLISKAIKELYKAGRTNDSVIKEKEITVAKKLIRRAFNLTTEKVSKITMFKPDMLALVTGAGAKELKTSVLSNQTLLFRDLVEVWWEPKIQERRQMIIDSAEKLSVLALKNDESFAKQLIDDAVSFLRKNDINSALISFDKAVVMINPDVKRKFKD